MTKDQLKNYFFGNTTVSESATIKQWIILNTDNPDFLDAVAELWDELPEMRDIEKTQDAYQKFINTTNYPKDNIDFDNSKKSKTRKMIQLLQRVASVIIIPCVLYLGYLQNQVNEPKKWIEKYVPYAEKTHITLPDSSSIWLNAGSKILYPKEFKGKSRQIYVSGEAYIDVAKNPLKPFFFSTRDIDIEVIGTKFNVKSFPEESETEIALVEGSINLNFNYKGKNKIHSLSPGQRIKINHETGNVDFYSFSPQEYIAWSDSAAGLYFHNMTLEQIVLELQRKFDVIIVIRDEEIKTERYFASFVNNESLTEILEMLNTNNTLKCITEKNIIDIYSRK